VKDISALREQPGGVVSVMGSAALVRAMLAADLCDELMLMIEPISLGGGKRMFPDDGVARGFELSSVTQAGTGVLICTYKKAR
jgi:dihydrofolate reductase